MTERICIHCDGPVGDRPQRVNRCVRCEKEIRRLANYAYKLTWRAVLLGYLPNLRDTYVKCTDCDKPAKTYDHRSYLRFTDVQPVCKGCNTLRGPVDMKLIWSCAA